ncbi:class I SAM-dependent methyltransferase [Heliorestis acidaminivorans]|nr:class I SAM-dependent methyltransferase [Heliorestis acidaminivorans]
MSEHSSVIKEKYNQKADKYDRLMAPMEKMMMAKWRTQLLRNVQGLVLEAGVGTGANLPYYPAGVKVIAVDFSSRMLELAVKKLPQTKAEVELKVADIQALPFSDNTFDTVIAACVFCTVPDPFQGFRELRRVIKPDGKLYFLEHVRSENVLLGPVMDYLNPIVLRHMGSNINRRTEENIQRSGMKILHCDKLFGDIVKRLTVIANK